MKNNLDEQLKNLYTKIINEGVKKETTNQFYPDGTPAYRYSLIGGSIRIDDGSLLFTTAKFTAPKSAINELLAFVRNCAFDIKTLNSLGVRVWDNQHYSDGTIGKAYGYQYADTYKVLTKNISNKTKNAIGFSHDKNLNEKYCYLNQFEYVIHKIIDDSDSTRIMTDIWNISDLDSMILEPCIYSSQWIVLNNKLNLIVKSRSSDSYLGLPFNLAQWSTIHHLIAKLTELEVGTFELQFGDVHLYDKHFEQAKKFIYNVNNKLNFTAPTLEIDENINWSNLIYGENFKLKNYKYTEKIPAILSNNLEEMKLKEEDKND